MRGGAIYKFEGQVSVFNYKGGPSYRCLFATPPAGSSVANCSEVGVLGVLPGIIGCMQANEVIKMILGMADVLSGKLLCYDARSASTNFISIARNEDRIKQVFDERDIFVKRNFLHLKGTLSTRQGLLACYGCLHLPGPARLRGAHQTQLPGLTWTRRPDLTQICASPVWRPPPQPSHW